MQLCGPLRPYSVNVYTSDMDTWIPEPSENMVALPPSDSLVQAVLGHPVWGAIRAIQTHHGGPPPIGEEARTVRAFVGPAFFKAFVGRYSVPRLSPEGVGDGEPGPPISPDEALQRTLSELEQPKVTEERREAWKKAVIVDEQTRRHHGEHIDGTDLGRSLRFRRLAATDDALRDGDALQAELAADRLKLAVTEALAPIISRDHVLRSLAFGKGLAEGWNGIEEIAGRRRPSGRLLHPKVEKYWRGVRKGVSEVLRNVQQRPNSGIRWLLRPRELAFFEQSGEAAAPASALFSWDRAGRPGSLTTFSARVGVNLPKATTETMIDLWDQIMPPPSGNERED